MNEIEGIVKSLENRLQQLFIKMESIEESNQDLKIKLKNSEMIIDNQSNQISDLKYNFDSIKITNSLLGSDEYKRDTKLKINSLIREIDYCIAQLSD